MHYYWYRSSVCSFIYSEWVSVLSSPPASAPEASLQPPHRRHLPHWEQRPLQHNGAPAPTHTGLVSPDRNTAPKFLMFNPALFFTSLHQDGETILKGQSVAHLLSSLFQTQRFPLMQPLMYSTGPTALLYLDLFAAGVNDKSFILTTFVPLKFTKVASPCTN